MLLYLLHSLHRHWLTDFCFVLLIFSLEYVPIEVNTLAISTSGPVPPATTLFLLTHMKIFLIYIK